MNQYLPRTEPVAAVAGVKERGFGGAQGVRPLAPAKGQAGAHARKDAPLTERSAVAASYAKLQADIADIVARLDPPRPDGPAHADRALLSLMPEPVVVLPLPPADQDMIAFVAQVAQSLAQQAARARAAQASVSPAVVDQLIH